MVDMSSAGKHARAFAARGPALRAKRAPGGAAPVSPPGTKTPAPLRKASTARRPRNGRLATVEDWLRIAEEKRAELIRGQIVYHALPGIEHGWTQAHLCAAILPYGRRRPTGGGGPGGWWLSLEVDIFLDGLGCRPDVVGWRRDKRARAPETNAQGVITDPPEFICEVLSRSTTRYDQGIKREIYHGAGVGHYWLVDPDQKTLTVLERAERGYLILAFAGPGETIHAAPFEEVPIVVDDLFMDDEAEPREAAPATEEEGRGPEALAVSPSAEKARARGKRPARRGEEGAPKRRKA